MHGTPEALAPSGKFERELIAALDAAPVESNRAIFVRLDSEREEDLKVRGAFVRWFLLEAVPQSGLPITRIELVGANIVDVLDLAAAKLGAIVRFSCCTFASDIDLTDASGIGLEFIACTIEGGLSADRLETTGAMLVRSPTYDDLKLVPRRYGARRKMEMKGKVRLCGATIRGNLDFRGCVLNEVRHSGDKRKTILADGIHVEGNVLFSDGFKCHGEIALNGSHIERNLDLSGARLTNYDGYSLTAAGSSIGGTIHLGRALPGALNKNPFRAYGTVRLEGAEVRGDLDCTGGKFYAVAVARARRRMEPLTPEQTYHYTSFEANGIKVHADFKFLGQKERRSQLTACGTVLISNAVIDGSIRCKHARCFAPVFSWPRKDHKNVPAKWSTRSYSINANGTKVGDDVIFGDGFESHGTIGLIAATVGCDLRFDGLDSLYHFPGHLVLTGDGMTVEGTLFIQGHEDENVPLRANGVFGFTLAKIGQGVYVEHVKFDCTARPSVSDPEAQAEALDYPSCGVYAPYTNVQGIFRWKRITVDRPPEVAESDCNADEDEGDLPSVWLYLQGAKAEEIDDDEESWKNVDRFNINGCTYDRLTDVSASDGEHGPQKFAADIEWRLQRLDREYAILNPPPREHESRLVYYLSWKTTHLAVAFRSLLRPLSRFAARWAGLHILTDDQFAAAIERFTPQPYLQLANTIRNAGYELAYQRIVIQLERNRTRYGDYSALAQCSRWIQDLVLRYGFLPFRPVLLLAIWIIFSAQVFDWAKHRELIVPSNDNQEKSDHGDDKPRVDFDHWIFAVDTLVPLVDLNQRKNWIVLRHPKSDSGSGSHRTTSGEAPGGGDFFSWLGGDWKAISLFVVNSFLGWVLTSFLAAGITGLLRGGKDSSGN